MTNAQHTPGPWHWHKGRTQQYLHNTDGSCFAEVTMPIPNRKYYEIGLRQEANARLIAAAPELLGALEDCMDYPCFVNDMPRELLEIVSAAIAKVRGGESWITQYHKNMKHTITACRLSYTATMALVTRPMTMTRGY